MAFLGSDWQATTPPGGVAVTYRAEGSWTAEREALIVSTATPGCARGGRGTQFAFLLPHDLAPNRKPGRIPGGYRGTPTGRT
jgi:hypothetical protein